MAFYYYESQSGRGMGYVRNQSAVPESYPAVEIEDWSVEASVRDTRWTGEAIVVDPLPPPPPPPTKADILAAVEMATTVDHVRAILKILADRLA